MPRPWPTGAFCAPPNAPWESHEQVWYTPGIALRRNLKVALGVSYQKVGWFCKYQAPFPRGSNRSCSPDAEIRG